MDKFNILTSFRVAIPPPPIVKQVDWRPLMQHERSARGSPVMLVVVIFIKIVVMRFIVACLYHLNQLKITKRKTKNQLIFSIGLIYGLIEWLVSIEPNQTVAIYIIIFIVAFNNIYLCSIYIYIYYFDNKIRMAIPARNIFIDILNVYTIIHHTNNIYLLLI